MNLCMAATYDPDPARAARLSGCPSTWRPAKLIPGRWKNWQAHDPINLVGKYKRHLKSLRGIYIDCGWRDQYHIHYGARILSKRLAQAGIRHTYEEFDDNHSDIDYRMDVSLPFSTGRSNRSASERQWRSVRNVLGSRLEPCSMRPRTGFFRDGCCNTGPDDFGLHVICAQMTESFLDFSRERGNDLSTPVPEHDFPGLEPGDRWCVCVARWREAFEAGVDATGGLDCDARGNACGRHAGRAQAACGAGALSRLLRASLAAPWPDWENARAGRSTRIWMRG